MTDCWNPHFPQLHPSFHQLLPLPATITAATTWPLCSDLNDDLPQTCINRQGKLIQFALQDASLPYLELYYEQRIFDHGLVSTRPNWHDFFNALIWQRYPQLKVAINEMHAGDMRQQPDKRTPQRDALTIFDENGIVIVSSQNSLLRDIIDFNWRKLFQYERQAWQQHCQCFVIGHALYEKFLTPYSGLTAHALLVKADDAFFEQSFAKQRTQLDQCIANAILDGHLKSPQALNPIPVLGVPEWWSEQTDAFYANSAYFRAKSRERQVKMLSLNPHEPV